MGLLAVLATVVVLLIAGILVRAVPAGVEYAGLHPAFGAVAGHLVALAAFPLLLACVRFVVVEYRRFADRAPEIRRPLALVAVPALGLAIPVVYALQVTGSARLPLALLALAVVSAHALAFRTISAWSRDAELAPLGQLAGVVAGTPAVFALVTLVTQRLPDGGLDAAGRILLETPGWWLVPRDGPFLVAFPLFVATSFGLYRRLRRGDRVDVPEPDVPRVGELRPSVSLPPVPSPPVSFSSVPLPAAVSRPVGRRFPDVTLTDVALASVARATERASERLGRTDDAVPRDAPPVPRPAGLRSGGSDGGASSPTDRQSSADSSPGEDSPGPRAPRSATAGSSSSRATSSRSGSPDRSPSTSSGDGTGDDHDSAEGAETGADVSATSSDEGDRSVADTSEASAAEASADDTPDADESGSADGTPDEPTSSPDDAESRTRIFSADVDDGSGGTVVETCPDCDADVPSDGTYEFCPLCGHEL